jgi:hypothetical protein
MLRENGPFCVPVLRIRKFDDLDVGLGPAIMGLLKTRYVLKLWQVLYFLMWGRFYTNDLDVGRSGITSYLKSLANSLE